MLADKTPFVSMTIPKANGRGTLDLQVKEVVRKIKTGQDGTRRCCYIAWKMMLTGEPYAAKSAPAVLAAG